MGTLLRSCVEVRELIELSFGIVSGVEPSIHVLDGGPHGLRVRVDFGVVCRRWPNGFNGVVFNRNAFDSCMRS